MRCLGVRYHAGRGEKRYKGALKSTPQHRLSRVALRGASLQPAQPCWHVSRPRTSWEPGSPASPLHLLLLSVEGGLAFKRAPKRLSLTFSHFQEKIKRGMLWGKRKGGNAECCGELGWVSWGGFTPKGSPAAATAAWILGSRNIWVAVPGGSSTDSQIVFLLLLPWRWEKLFCRDRSTQGTRGSQKDLRWHLFFRRSTCSSKRKLEVQFLHIP